MDLYVTRFQRSCLCVRTGPICMEVRLFQKPDRTKGLPGLQKLMLAAHTCQPRWEPTETCAVPPAGTSTRRGHFPAAVVAVLQSLHVLNARPGDETCHLS